MGEAKYKLSAEKRKTLEEKLEELTALRSVIGLEWHPDEDEINRLEQETEAVAAAIQCDDNLREEVEIEI